MPPDSASVEDPVLARMRRLVTSGEVTNALVQPTLRLLETHVVAETGNECVLCGFDGQNIDCTYPCDALRLADRLLILLTRASRRAQEAVTDLTPVPADGADGMSAPREQFRVEVAVGMQMEDQLHALSDALGRAISEWGQEQGISSPWAQFAIRHHTAGSNIPTCCSLGAQQALTWLQFDCDRDIAWAIALSNRAGDG